MRDLDYPGINQRQAAAHNLRCAVPAYSVINPLFIPANCGCTWVVSGRGRVLKFPWAACPAVRFHLRYPAVL